MLLRQWRDADRRPFGALNADPEVMRYFPSTVEAAVSDAMLDRCRDAIERQGWGLWAVEVQATAQLIGFVGLNRPVWEAPFTPCTEIGWRLARSAWGQGYATEAAREAVRVAFDEVGIDEVVSFTTVDNRRSRAVMERLAMSRDPGEDFDHPRIAEGSPHRRHVLYRLPRNAWLPLSFR
ncbi:GNAT family N-acetyltransferase [Lapillicoccus sp.]|uniref:GNAT family N-acetyltransferase n=1 Tax=Lapillicoccus sp. TaxID=1909287 RepID=UPI0032670662